MAQNREEMLQKYPSLKKYAENDDDYVEVCTKNLRCFHFLLLGSPGHLQVSPAYSILFYSFIDTHPTFLC